MNLKGIKSELELPEAVINKANSIFHTAAEKNLLRGRSAEKILAGALYVASRKAHRPRSLYQIADVFHISERECCKGYKQITRNLDIDVPPVDPCDCLPYLQKKLDLDEKTIQKARNIVTKAKKEGVATGRCPFGVAAAALYIVTLTIEREITQKEITEASSVSEITVRNRFKEMVEKLDVKIESS